MSNIKLEKTYNKFNQLTQNQSINITKALVKGLGDGDKININYSPVMIVNEAEVGNPLSEMQEVMWAIIESLPPPKMENLRKFAFKTCLDKFGDKLGAGTKAAAYLDMQRTYISRMKHELAEDPLFKEEEEKAELPVINVEEEK